MTFSHIRTRFPPSPTGFLHIGGLRTALYNYLFAKRNGGEFILRIEDTDTKRYVEGAEQQLVETLHRSGLTYTEGPDIGGPHAPYTQSQCLPLYLEHAHKLLATGHAYYCFCTAERLEELRETQKLNNQTTKYDRHCLTLSPHEVEQRLQAKEAWVIRMKIPDNCPPVVFTDLIRGSISVETTELDDQVLIKSDGYPTYHLANVVDDHRMLISHVIRGEEWISSTPKHILLYKAFGWELPQFAHLPLLLNPDKTKLSKRQGSVAVEDFYAEGYTPEALLNFVALMGWNPKADQELYSLEELVPLFDITKVNKAGAVFNKEKLDWINSEYLKRMTPNAFARAAEPFLEHKGLLKKMPPRSVVTWWTTWARIEQMRVKKLSEAGEETRCAFEAPAPLAPEKLIWKKGTKEGTQAVLEGLLKFFETTPNETVENITTLETELKQWIETQKLTNGEVLWPLRVSLSHQDKSPGPFELAALVGKNGVIQRLTEARNLLIS